MLLSNISVPVFAVTPGRYQMYEILRAITGDMKVN